MSIEAPDPGELSRSNPASSGAVLLRVAGLSKSYGGVRALNGVDLEIGRGEIHGLCGENGAGKSTLIKILSGVLAPDEGAVTVDGQVLPPGNVHAAECAGIAVIHQESTAFPDLNALDNIFVGREPRRGGGLFLDRSRMRGEARAVLDRLGQQIDIEVPVRDLSVAQRQMVAMARALSRRCRFLILDEPTASLAASETRALLRLIGRLRDQGVTILLVSHRLEEIFEWADRVTVLRDGERVATRSVGKLDKETLIRWMVGREVEELTRRHAHGGDPGAVRLGVRGLSRPPAFEGVDLAVRAGEIVGVAGLVGAGRSEVVRAVFGIDSYVRGEVWVDGVRLRGGSVRAAMDAGIALVPEDRQHEGLVLPMSVGANISLAVLTVLTRCGLIDRRRERGIVDRGLRDLAVKTSDSTLPAASLSGGNQQKLVLGKWLAADPRVLILDEPTRGIDVGAKAQVHRLIRRLAARGIATLMVSSDMPEVLSVSDRIVVMRGGRVSGVIDGNSATQERVLELALPDEAGGAVP